jgi:hypothetical protein
MNYQRHYNLLIEKHGLKSKPNGYSEKHHIVPRCLGGSDDESNLIYLSAEAHYVAHQLLVKMNPNHYGIAYAALLMTRSTSQVARNNKLYGWLKSRFSKECSINTIKRFSVKENHPCFSKFGSDHPRFGKRHSEEAKAKIGLTHKGKIKSDESKRKQSETCKRVFNTDDYINKISEIRKIAFKGNKNPAFGTKMINNGFVRKRIPKDQNIPDGWLLGAKFN